MKYIAYGSNMVTAQMASRCPTAQLIGTGHLAKARLAFYLHATVEPTDDPADRVPVAVWELSPADEAALDRYEGWPSYYRKEVWPAQMDDGSELTGMIYLMQLIRPNPPRRDYYAGILQAYRALGFADEVKTVLEPALQRSLQRR